ncbi:hypothetical protein ABT224_35645 [Streptomyces sp. NPDC001584]|uniref:hypothetical protein n=1 Tax=Streptomyces sp. NPDC001584 TaxID=3154521 RepID=UPI00333445E5
MAEVWVAAIGVVGVAVGALLGIFGARLQARRTYGQWRKESQRPAYAELVACLKESSDVLQRIDSALSAGTARSLSESQEPLELAEALEQRLGRAVAAVELEGPPDLADAARAAETAFRIYRMALVLDRKDAALAVLREPSRSFEEEMGNPEQRHLEDRTEFRERLQRFTALAQSHLQAQPRAR